MTEKKTAHPGAVAIWLRMRRKVKPIAAERGESAIGPGQAFPRSAGVSCTLRSLFPA